MPASAQQHAPKINLGIVSTTIHGEAGYLPFDRLAAQSPFASVTFYVAGDLDSPPFDTAPFACPVRFPGAAEQGGFHCSSEIGWHKIMRRNLALLRCIADQPDFILMVDDDNVPPPDYFETWHRVLTTAPRRAVYATSTDADGPVWHNYLRSADAAVEIYPRGFPVAERGRGKTEIRPIAPGSVAAADIWLFQGISLGEPDVDAMTRIVVGPWLQRVEELDFVLRDVWSPYNTQNTVFAPALFPLAVVWPHCGRYDDIFASFTWQQLAFSQRKFAHTGNPVNTQGRRRRNPTVDLSAEVEGILGCSEVMRAITSIEATDAVSFLEMLSELPGPELIVRHRPFFEAFRRDLDGVGHR
jgi:hypothetical protein